MPLSARQMEYLALAWQCFEGEPKIDYDKFKTVAGLASVHSARELMRVTKKKLKEEYGALSDGVQSANNGNATPRTPNTGSPRKRAAQRTGTGRKSTAKKNATPTATAAADGEASDDGAGDETRVRKRAMADPAWPATSAAEVKDEAEGDGEEEEEEEDYF